MLANALRIAFDSIHYRVKKHEATNFLATLSMLLVFGAEGLDLVLRISFAVVLNLVIYLVNDYCDLDVDLRDTEKNRPKTLFMAEHRRASRLAVVGELTILGGIAVAHFLVFKTALLPAALVINVTLYYAYSRWLKRIPIVDVLSMTLAGATSTMVGAPNTIVGYQLLGLLGLLSGCYEIIQVIRDVDNDTQQGVLTTAVFLGPQRAARLFRAFIIATALYGMLLVGTWAAAGFLFALLLPVNPEEAARSWDKARVIFGLSWLGVLVQIYLGL